MTVETNVWAPAKMEAVEMVERLRLANRRAALVADLRPFPWRVWLAAANVGLWVVLLLAAIR